MPTGKCIGGPLDGKYLKAMGRTYKVPELIPDELTYGDSDYAPVKVLNHDYVFVESAGWIFRVAQ